LSESPYKRTKLNETQKHVFHAFNQGNNSAPSKSLICFHSAGLQSTYVRSGLLMA